jgi:hypothetical protein
MVSDYPSVGYPMTWFRLPQKRRSGVGEGWNRNPAREGQAKALVRDQRVLISSLVDWFESCPLTSTLSCPGESVASPLSHGLLIVNVREMSA